MGGSDLFDYVIGALALLSTIFSVLAFSRKFLPEARMKILDSLLDETLVIYEKAVADGLLRVEVQVKLQATFNRLEEACGKLRNSTYQHTSVVDEYFSLSLSQDIIQLSNNVKKLRSFIVTTSEENKRKMGITFTRSIVGVSTCATHINPIPQQHTSDDRPRRPNSCPPDVSFSMLPTATGSTGISSSVEPSSGHRGDDDLVELESTLNALSTLLDPPTRTPWYRPGCINIWEPRVQSDPDEEMGCTNTSVWDGKFSRLSTHMPFWKRWVRWKARDHNVESSQLASSHPIEPSPREGVASAESWPDDATLSGQALSQSRFPCIAWPFFIRKASPSAIANPGDNNSSHDPAFSA